MRLTPPGLLDGPWGSGSAQQLTIAVIQVLCEPTLHPRQQHIPSQHLLHRGNRSSEGQEDPSVLPGAFVHGHEGPSVDGVHITEFPQSIALPSHRALALCTAQSHTRQHRLLRSHWHAQSTQAHIRSSRPEDENMDTLGLADQWQSLMVLNRGHTRRLYAKWI